MWVQSAFGQRWGRWRKGGRGRVHLSAPSAVRGPPVYALGPGAPWVCAPVLAGAQTWRYRLTPQSRVGEALLDLVPCPFRCRMNYDATSCSFGGMTKTFGYPEGSELWVLMAECRNSVVDEFDVMQKAAQDCDIQVPLGVIKLIDDGKNPDEFTKKLIEECINNNQKTKGKTEAFKDVKKHLCKRLCAIGRRVRLWIEGRETNLVVSAVIYLLTFLMQENLRKNLLEELEQAFPEEVEAYRELRAASAASNVESTTLFLRHPKGTRID
eukprot:Gb_36353 [translate_table: standard]